MVTTDKIGDIWRQLWHHLSKKNGLITLTGLLAASGVLALRAFGSFQMLELRAFDKMLALRKVESVDPRIVIVGITDADLDNYLRTAFISDQVMVDLIHKIKSQQPRVIGLDFYRNLPREPGTENLAKIFAQTSNLIGIEKVIGNDNSGPISGNAILKAADHIAASDIIVDPDGRVRRGLLFPAADGSNIVESLGLRLALEYLAGEPSNITPDPHAPVLTLNNVQFPPIEAYTGGYVDTDAQGYQILLNLRQRPHSFNVVSLQQVLHDEIPPDLMRDRIVLIGNMAFSNSDIFYTAGKASKNQTTIQFGVELHGELASQIINTALNNRPLIYAWPPWIENLLIISVTIYGCHLTQKTTKLWQRLTLIPGISLLIVGGSYGALSLIGLWLPVIPVLLGLWTSAGLMGAHRTSQLQVLSTNDKLTGLANRRTFDESLQQAWFRALRSQQSLALIVGDVDHFKKYNDTYGHPQGDECLKRVAQAIRTTVKSSSALTARYGGEEFVVLLPNTSTEQGVAIANAILLKLAAYQLPHEASDTAAYVTMSLGVTSFIPRLEIPPSALVEMADLGLYTAKKSGRNCVRLHQPNTISQITQRSQA